MRGDTTFEDTGRLIKSNLVMYDRQTDSYWSQVWRTPINGAHKDERLESFPVTWTTWKQWRDEHLEIDVMTRRTG